MLRSPAGLRCRRKRTHAVGVHPLPPAVLLPDEGQSNALHGCTRVKHRVSACEPLCAILLAKAGVYPPQSLETNVAAFVPEVLKAVRPMCWKRWYDCVSCAFHGFFEDEKESRINGWRRNRRSAQSFLPAVRAVDGGFNAVGCGAF